MDGERIRVQKALSAVGLMSRRAAEDAIRAGRVTVDEKQVRLGDRVDVVTQRVAVDGVPIPVNPDLVTYLVYKPVGVISTADDPEGRRTIVELVPTEKRLYPVGRLDRDSEGLILLTNDGELANRVTHPRYGIQKKYLARVTGIIGNEQVARLMEGIELDDGPATALKARVIDRSGDTSLVELTLGEGRNREVRRMFEAIGCQVQSLVRTSIGPISDRKLKSGQYRLLSAAEVRDLLGSGA